MKLREADRRTRIAIAIAFALGAAAIVPAQAQTVEAMPTSDTGWSICNGGGCRWGTGDPPNPYVRQVPHPLLSEDERKAADARMKAWTDRCKPTTHFDKYGVERATYAAPGCEFGQTR